jgi:hypothetical protein
VRERLFLRSLTLGVAGFGRGPNPEANNILDFILDSIVRETLANNGKKKMDLEEFSVGESRLLAYLHVCSRMLTC